MTKKQVKLISVQYLGTSSAHTMLVPGMWAPDEIKKIPKDVADQLVANDNPLFKIVNKLKPSPKEPAEVE